jgi:hypothetical protein
MTCSVEHGLKLVLADRRRASRSTYQTTLDRRSDSPNRYFGALSIDLGNGSAHLSFHLAIWHTLRLLIQFAVRAN